MYGGTSISTHAEPLLAQTAIGLGDATIATGCDRLTMHRVTQNFRHGHNCIQIPGVGGNQITVHARSGTLVTGILVRR